LTFSFGGKKGTTDPIDFNATADTVKTKLGAALSAAGVSGGIADLGVSVTGGLYSVEFRGADLAGKHVDALTADVSKLRNTNPLGTINVSAPQSSTTTFNAAADLAKLLQDKINEALIKAGLTPGFMNTGALTSVAAGGTTTTASFTADFAPF